MTLSRYIKNLLICPLIGIDMMINTLLGGNPWETISSSVGRQAMAGEVWALRLEKIIDSVMGAGHCRRNIITEGVLT
jgi:hypothetical protein